MADTTTPSFGSNGGYTQYVGPSWQGQTSAGIAGGLQGFTGDNGYINNTLQNWYSDPLTAGYDANSTRAYEMAGQTNPYEAQVAGAAGQGAGYRNALPTAQGYVNQGVGGLNAAGQQTQDAATWNRGEQQQFMNPYVTNVVNEQARLSNQNLTENVLPAVNSTFTGAGQFGSSRNADFNNRAIRDQQYNLAGLQGKTLMDAQTNAAQQYGQWADRGLNAGQQLATNATNLGNMGALTNTIGRGYLDYGNYLTNNANAGNTIRQQGISNLATTGADYRGVEQGALDRNKTDWEARRDYPLAALTKVSAVNAANAGTIHPDVIQQPGQLDEYSRIIDALKTGISSTSDMEGFYNQLKTLFNTDTATNTGPNSGWNSSNNGGA